MSAGIGDFVLTALTPIYISLKKNEGNRLSQFSEAILGSRLGEAPSPARAGA